MKQSISWNTCDASDHRSTVNLICIKTLSSSVQTSQNLSFSIISCWSIASRSRKLFKNYCFRERWKISHEISTTSWYDIFKALNSFANIDSPLSLLTQCGRVEPTSSSQELWTSLKILENGVWSIYHNFFHELFSTSKMLLISWNEVHLMWSNCSISRNASQCW